MFEVIGTMRGLGFRNDRTRFDIEFPTRNHLKVFLARLINKRRLQLEKGLTDLHSMNTTAIISSTDYCETNVVSKLCKSVFTPRQGEGGRDDHGTFSRQSPARNTNGGFSAFVNNSPRRNKNKSGIPGAQSTNSRWGTFNKNNNDEDVKLDREVVMSTWIDEVEL